MTVCALILNNQLIINLCVFTFSHLHEELNKTNNESVANIRNLYYFYKNETYTSCFMRMRHKPRLSHLINGPPHKTFHLPFIKMVIRFYESPQNSFLV